MYDGWSTVTDAALNKQASDLDRAGRSGRSVRERSFAGAPGLSGVLLGIDQRRGHAGGGRSQSRQRHRGRHVDRVLGQCQRRRLVGSTLPGSRAWCGLDESIFTPAREDHRRL